MWLLFCVSLKIFACSVFATSTHLSLGVVKKQSVLLCCVRLNKISRFMDPQILQRDTSLAGHIRTEDSWETQWIDSCFFHQEQQKPWCSLEGKEWLTMWVWNVLDAQGKHMLCMGWNFFFNLQPLRPDGNTKLQSWARFLNKGGVKSVPELPDAVPSEPIEKSKQNQCEAHCQAKAFYHHVWFKSELL